MKVDCVMVACRPVVTRDAPLYHLLVAGAAMLKKIFRAGVGNSSSKSFKLILAAEG
jgi:hypothetical protein